MRWTTSARVALVSAVFGVTTQIAGAEPICDSLSSLIAIAASPTGKPIDFLLGIRLGLTENPRLESGSDNRNSDSKAGLFGAQITVVHEEHFLLGFGLEHFATGYTHFRDDTLFGLVEDNQFSGWLFYVSPGVHTRLGKDQPLGFGLNVDAGFLWARGNFLTHDFSSSWGDRLGAIRPKAVATYDITPDMLLQFESGWLWAENSGYFAYYDFYDGPRTHSWSMDFTGPYIASMLTSRLPSRPRPRPAVGERVPAIGSTVSGPNIIAGLRGGMLPGAVESLPARWDFGGEYGAPIARGLQVSLATRKSIEFGLGFELMATPYTNSADTLFGDELRASGTFLYATLVYEGLSTPMRSVPLGVAVDVGHLWARESIRSAKGYGYGSRSTELEGNAARLKFTVSPRIVRAVGLRFEIGWLFASLGEQSPPPVPGDRWMWERPSAMDFSGLSIIGMVRLMSQ